MPENNLHKVIVFIPALNEEETIGHLIDAVREMYSYDKTVPNEYYIEIMAVNDGSTDKTEEIIKSKKINFVSHPKNLGLGAATRTALEYSFDNNADVAVKLDADFQHDPEDIEKVILPIIENKCDICWGSRFTGKINYKMPFIRYFGNRFFTMIMNKLTNYSITDAQTGLMAFGRKYLKVFEILGNYNPPQQILIDANVKHMRYFETPVVFNPRTTGSSFVSLKYPFKVILSIIRILVYANPLKVFGSIGITMILASLLVFITWITSQVYDLNIIEELPDTTSLILFIGGLQTLFFGIIADMIIKRRK